MKMQVFGRCGALGIVTIDATSTDTVGSVKEQLCQRYPELGTPSQLAVFYRGRVWRSAATLGRARVSSGATLDVQGRLRGGGGDGGSTGAESRSSYLEMYKGKKNDKVDPAEEKLAKWTTCHLTGEPLCPPVVADELGSLFNKDAVIKALVAKSLPKSLPHINGLKSLIPLKLERNPHAAKAADGGKANGNGAAKSNGGGNGAAKTAGNYHPGNEAEFSCPISGLPMNGRFKFVALRPSGLVVSEKALKEARAAVLELVGGAEWGPSDVLLLNPDGEALDKARERVLVKLAAAKAKKASKRAAKAEVGANGGGVAAAAAEAGDSNGAGDGPYAEQQQKGPRAKKAKAAIPGGDSDVYRSIFLDPSRREKETYCCRATSARGMNLT